MGLLLHPILAPHPNWTTPNLSWRKNVHAFLGVWAVIHRQVPEYAWSVNLTRGRAVGAAEALSGQRGGGVVRS